MLNGVLMFDTIHVCLEVAPDGIHVNANLCLNDQKRMNQERVFVLFPRRKAQKVPLKNQSSRRKQSGVEIQREDLVFVHSAITQRLDI